jgi:hypothetical protein
MTVAIKKKKKYIAYRLDKIIDALDAGKTPFSGEYFLDPVQEGYLMALLDFGIIDLDDYKELMEDDTYAYHSSPDCEVTGWKTKSKKGFKRIN